MKTKLLVCTLFISTITIAQQRVGINTNSPLETLDVNGNTNLRGLLKINNNPGANGQVLMSKGGAEEPVWTHTAYTGGGRFIAFYQNNSNSTGRQGFTTQSATSTQEDSIDLTTFSNTGSDFTIVNAGTIGNHIQINRTGLYHFDGLVRLFASIDADITMLPRGYLQFKANQPSPGIDYEFYIHEGIMDRIAGNSVGHTTTFHNLGADFNLNIQLLEGTTVTIITGISNLKYPLSGIGVSTGGFISGYFISE